MRWTGLKKWKPQKRSGCCSPSASLSTESEEVLVASTRVLLEPHLELAEHAALDVEVLDHRFDREIGAAHAGELERRENARQLRVPIPRGVPSATLPAALVDDRFHGLERTRERSGVARRAFAPRWRSRLASSAMPPPITPAPNSARDFTGRGTNARVRDHGAFLRALGELEDADQVLAHRAGHEIADPAGLEPESGLERLPEPVLHHADRRHRGGVVTAGAGARHRAGAVEDQGATERIAVEQPRHGGARVVAVAPARRRSRAQLGESSMRLFEQPCGAGPRARSDPARSARRASSARPVRIEIERGRRLRRAAAAAWCRRSRERCRAGPRAVRSACAAPRSRSASRTRAPARCRRLGTRRRSRPRSEPAARRAS